VLEAVASAHARAVGLGDEDGWLLGHGWSIDQLGGRPDGAQLARVAPGRAIALWSHDHHSRWLSERALTLAGLGPETADPPGGRLGRRADGRLDGLLHEHAASLVDRAIPPVTAAVIRSLLAGYARTLAALGVTAVHDPGEVTDDPRMERGPAMYRALAFAEALPLRVVASVREEQLGSAIDAHVGTGRSITVLDSAAPEAARRIERYRDGWLKLFADGALGSRSAALLEPYETTDPAGPPLGGPNGMLVSDRAALLRAATMAAGAGIATQIHGIGDAAVRLALDVLGGVPVQGGARHRVEHAQLVSAEDAERFASLGVAASVQPCHLITDAEPARAAWGARTARAFPLRDLDRAGALIPFGTDAPVEPPDPWRGIAIAVTRSSGSWRRGRTAFHAEQRLPLWRALRAASLDGPRSLGIADEGHLGVGARADLIVVDAAIVDEHPRPGGALEVARPSLTLLDGEAVHRSPGFDP
jgi:hypothetical protein